MKKTVVLSLGGSLIIPDKVNVEFLELFKKVILRHTNKYKFVIVCGGGSVARTYIQGLEDQHIKKKAYLQSMLGISVTRTNARFMTYFFGRDANQGIPHDMRTVRNLLAKHDVVFCGALRYETKQTSDSTAAKLAKLFNCDFINLTNIKGLYDKNPKTSKTAKFIPEISHRDFLKIANKLTFHPGQHFVLDQTAAKIINKYKIRTFIIGDNMKNLDKVLTHKHFIGTIIN
jgi:uridylate kinase